MGRHVQRRPILASTVIVLLLLFAFVVDSLADQTAWTPQASGTTSPLQGVACISASRCWAVGDTGTIRVTINGGATWSGQASGTLNRLRAIACPTSTQCFAVGDGGTIRATTNGGSTWSSQVSGVVGSLRAISCPASGTCWAVGDTGTIVTTTNGGTAWSPQTSGNVNNFYGIACPSTSKCWAVGASGTLIATTNGGTTWSAQTSGTSAVLEAISCKSQTTCAAVGDNGTIRATTNSGSTWTGQTSGTTRQLLGISCPSGGGWCWTGGALGTVLSGSPTWTSETPGTANTLHAISCPTSAQCFAVGDGGVVLYGQAPPSNSAPPTISGIAQDYAGLSATTGSWNGAPPFTYSYQWRRCDSAGSNCTDIAWATGASYTLGHADVGSTIRVVVTATNPAGNSTAISAPTAVVSAAPPSIRVSPAISGTPREGKTLSSDHGDWDGTPPLSYAYQWQRCDDWGDNCTDIAGANSSSYVAGSTDVGHALDVVVTATNAAGSASDASLSTEAVVSAASMVWTELDEHTFDNFNAIACSSTTKCWAVGWGAILATTDGGTTWTSQYEGSADLRAIACPSTSRCWAVGGSGAILTTSDGGSTWTTQSSGLLVTPTFYALSCPTTTQCWAVGTSGTILATSNGGSSWSQQVSSTPTALYGISCPSTSRCWAVGGRGTIVTTGNGGTAWSPQLSGTSNDLDDVACPSTSRCWAVSLSGAILTTSNAGSNWTTQRSGDYVDGISCASASACWAVGDTGLVLATSNSGSDWTRQLSATTEDLRSIACPSSDQCYAVGWYGTILVGQNPLVNTTGPTITPESTVQEGKLLNGGHGAWSGAQPITFSYQWKTCTSATDVSTCTNEPASNATSRDATYWPGAYDVGKYVRLAVTATNPVDEVTKLTAATTALAAGDDCETYEGCANSYSTAVSGDHPNAYYRLNEPLGENTAVNSSAAGSQLNGTYNAGLRRLPGPLTKHDWSVRLADISVSAPLSEQAVEFFARDDDPTAQSDVVYYSHGDVSGTIPYDGLVIYRSAEDTMRFAYDMPAADGSRVSGDDELPCLAPNQDSWAQYDVTWSDVAADGNRVLRCFVDGSEAGDSNRELSGNWVESDPSDTPMTISGDSANIDEFSTWNALTDQQIADHNNAAGGARSVDGTPPVTGTILNANGTPATGYAAVYLDPSHTADTAMADGDTEELPLLAVQDPLTSAGAFSLTPQVNDAVRQAAALNGGVVTLELDVQAPAFTYTHNFSRRLVGDQLVPLETNNPGVDKSDYSATAPATTSGADLNGFVIYDSSNEDTRSGGGAYYCMQKKVGQDTGFTNLGEAHTWASEGVHFDYAVNHYGSTSVSIALRSSNGWGVDGSRSVNNNVGTSYQPYFGDHQARVVRGQMLFYKYEYTGACGHYFKIYPEYLTGGFDYQYTSGVYDGYCSTSQYRVSVLAGASQTRWTKTTGEGEDFAGGVSVFGVNIFHSESGWSKNTMLEYILSGGSGKHWYCGNNNDNYPAKARVVYAGY